MEWESVTGLGLTIVKMATPYNAANDPLVFTVEEIVRQNTANNTTTSG